MTRATGIEDHHIAFAGQLADAARAVLARETAQGLEVEVKPDRSFVTRIDRAIEAELRAMIARGPVTLLFAAHDAQHNNAVALRDYLAQ